MSLIKRYPVTITTKTAINTFKHVTVYTIEILTWYQIIPLSNISTRFEFASKGDLGPLIQWSPSLSNFHPKKSSTPT